ncbi:probable polygalacturonase [Dendrobium catenatum]|uniref:Putative polygalacturonase n=1 Tax=Dendrobium catenatum TaxID=906689 RepID=A0A2I0X1H2_9ASPA|nr:probable polygalacturonase [Dendrobium catenatum]XP_020697413.1 probable polygalacturonase [Dendrobium catenatum]PKU81764.1 putative polygalacturonase [Dendrobium catenatum]
MERRGITATTATAAMLLALLLTPLLPQAVAEESCSGIVPMRSRREVISIEDFGGIGDGRTDNTWPFRKAIYRIQHLRRLGGTLLYVPRGVWLTGSFNVTSHMTLFLARGAVIKASQDTEKWPLVEPLPSYGRGRERPGGRYASFILGYGLRDVIITGENGTIDGQGGVWWDMWRQRTLSFTRPNLLEFMHSTDIHISNIIFKNSPFWNIHPVYCSNVVIRSVTILAPHDSPNTDGIDPDSSSNVCIEDSFISTGDDLVAVKSGWDEYGIAYGRPSTAITIRRITGSSPFSAIAIGSEASGGVENILIQNINIYSTGIGIHIKTNAGRGGYIRNVTISDVYMNRVGKGVRIAGDVGDHPDDKFDPGALPRVDGVTIRNVWGVGVKEAGSIEGIKGSPFTRICLWNVKLWGVGRQMEAWKCAAVSGVAVGVQPWPCGELTGIMSTGFCYS